VPPFSNKSIGFAAFNNFLGEVPRYNDLATFEAEYAPYAASDLFSARSIKGGSFNQTSTNDSVEANLDAQYISAIGYPVPIRAYSTLGLGELVPDLDQPDQPGSNEPYLDFLTYILAQPDRELPHVVSTSYGEDEQSVPLSYRKKVCNLFGQLGARGVSVIFSSGDTGVGSACQTNDGKNTTRFLPTFPGACPYVTSVGGTYKVLPERAIAFSSGGFSDTWPTPSYQKKAVKRYLSILGSRWKGLYNPKGRGFPDVSAQSYRFHVVDKQREILVGGTSASAPAFAGIVALLNAYRLKAGKPTMGFLNPWIYDDGLKAFTDIVDGGSTGCTGEDMYSGLPTPVVPYASWNATKGWDPVTGVGTPLFDKMLKAALKVKGKRGDGW
jgi:tripeptidyl-peptidase-1